MQMPPFSALAAQSTHVHTHFNAAGNVDYSRLIEALRMDVDAIGTVMTHAQRQVIAPSRQALPLSAMRTAVWDGSEEAEQAQRAERDRQRTAYEQKWGRPRGGWGA